jgi:hypothetical protein
VPADDVRDLAFASGSYTYRMFEATKHAAIVIAARGIKHEWIAHAILQPAKSHADADDPLLEHRLAPIPAFGFRVLRVIFRRGTVPPLVITAYFDRTMKGKL